jgi:hypothetical protein
MLRIAWRLPLAESDGVGAGIDCRSFYGQPRPAVSARRAATTPAFHPNARPPLGGSIASASMPVRSRSQATIEFEFHNRLPSVRLRVVSTLVRAQCRPFPPRLDLCEPLDQAVFGDPAQYATAGITR